MPQPTAPPRPFANLTGRNAVVTGSSSGIGRAIALELAAAGANLVIHYRQSRDRAEAVANEVRNLGRTAHLLAADVGQESQLAPFVEACHKALGTLDIWVNNAGADLLTGDAPRWTFEKKLETLLDVDVRSAVLLSRDVGRRMQAAGQGVILNIGWDQADRGMDGGGDSAELFSATKNAIMGFTRSLAMTLAPAVRVNCIAPGWIRTAWGDGASDAWQERVLRETPLRRWGLPEDIARLARFLVSDEANFITGQVINSNGGAVR